MSEIIFKLGDIVRFKEPCNGTDIGMVMGFDIDGDPAVKFKGDTDYFSIALSNQLEIYRATSPLKYLWATSDGELGTQFLTVREAMASHDSYIVRLDWSATEF